VLVWNAAIQYPEGQKPKYEELKLVTVLSYKTITCQYDKIAYTCKKLLKNLYMHAINFYGTYSIAIPV
jgi:hypothetical protein